MTGIVLKGWMAQVMADTEARRANDQAQREERAAAEATAVRERLKPLDERLARLLVSMIAETGPHIFAE